MATRRKSKPNAIVTGEFLGGEWKESLGDVLKAGQVAAWGDLVDENIPPRPGRGSRQLAADLIVICQERRGQIADEQVARLRSRFPQAGLVLVYAPWCEGETRSDRPVAGVPRVPASLWPVVWRRFCRDFEQSGTSSWHAHPAPEYSEPDARSAAQEGRTENISARLPRRLAGIAGRDRELLVAVRQVLRSAGCATRLLPGARAANGIRVAGCDALVVDCCHGIGEAIRWSAVHGREVPVLALLGFPRTDDVRRLKTAQPASALLPKPFDNQDLIEALAHLFEQQPTICQRIERRA